MFVVAKTPKIAPGVLVNENWNPPLVKTRGLARKGGEGTGTLICITLLVLGIPFTKIVIMANPGGKPVIGSESAEAEDQFVWKGKTAMPLPKVRSWMTGKSVEEF
jgi:hypothetical protein